MGDREVAAGSRYRAGMRSGIPIAALAAILLFALVPAFGGTSAEPPPRIERPTYQLGEKWILNDGIYELIRFENDRYVFSAGLDQTITLTRDLMIQKIQRGSHTLELHPAPQISWPLEVGKWGSGQAELNNSQLSPMSRYSVRYVWSAEAYDQVRTAAGTFTAARITVIVDPTQGVGGVWRGKLTVWYAPEIQQLVKVESSSALSLIGNLQVVAIDQPHTPSVVQRPPEPAAQVHAEKGGRAIEQSQPSAPRAERPTYRVGEKWIRDDGVYELVRIENDRYIFSAGPGHEVHLTKDLGIARVQKGAQFSEIDPPPQLKWPLEIGSWGESRATWRTQGLTAPARAIWSVEAYEEIRVPAGTFKAFRIYQRAMEIGVADLESFKVWYAPEVHQFVKLEVFRRSAFLAYSVVAVDRPALAPTPAAPGGAPVPPAALSPPSASAPPTAPAQAPGPTVPSPAAAPPTIVRLAIASPADQSQATQETIALAGLVSGGKGFTRVVVTLNGTEVMRQEEQTP